MATTSALTPAVAGLVEHVAGGGPSGPPPGLPLLSTVAAYAAVAGAGLLVAPLLTRVDVDTRLRRVLLSVVGLGYLGLLVAMLWRGEAGTERSGAAALAVLLAALAAARRSRTDQAIAGAVLLAVQAQADGAGDGTTHYVAIAVHLV